jgi:hypothetical protein
MRGSPYPLKIFESASYGPFLPIFDLQLLTWRRAHRNSTSPLCLLMHASHWLHWSLAPTVMSNSTCSYRFSSEGGRFIDYVEAARASPQSKLTTQPNLGLLDLVHESDGGSSDEGQGWGGLARYVEHRNDKSEPGVSYKVLLLVRHGRGVHNVVMDEVGSAEWKVINTALLA